VTVNKCVIPKRGGKLQQQIPCENTDRKTMFPGDDLVLIQCHGHSNDLVGRASSFQSNGKEVKCVFHLITSEHRESENPSRELLDPRDPELGERDVDGAGLGFAEARGEVPEEPLDVSLIKVVEDLHHAL